MLAFPPFDLGTGEPSEGEEYTMAVSGTKSGANAGKSNCHLSFSLRQQMGSPSPSRTVHFFFRRSLFVLVLTEDDFGTSIFRREPI